jgi:hypothetical protein
MTLDANDLKWLNALDEVYPVLGSTLPFYRKIDGSVDAVRTLQQFLTLIGAKIGSDGRVLEPYDTN